MKQDKTLIQEHAEALEQIKLLSDASKVSNDAKIAAEQALLTEKDAHKATNDKLAEITKQCGDALKAVEAKELEKVAINEKNEKLAYALSHPSFKALLAAGLSTDETPKQGGQSEDKTEVKPQTKKEEYLAMKAKGMNPIDCAKFYKQHEQAIKTGK